MLIYVKYEVARPCHLMEHLHCLNLPFYIRFLGHFPRPSKKPQSQFINIMELMVIFRDILFLHCCKKTLEIEMFGFCV